MRLISLTDVKSFLEITNNNHDLLLSKIIERVSKRIESFLNRLLVKQERTVYRNAGKRYYYLPAYPIDESATLTVVCDGVTQTKNTDYFVWSDEGLIEFQKDAIPSYQDPKEVVITWTGGYATSGEGDTECLAVPEDIQDAALKQVVYNYRRRKDIGVSSISMPDGSVTKMPIDASLLPEVKDELIKYRRPGGEW
jgi:hypothetical protein